MRVLRETVLSEMQSQDTSGDTQGSGPAALQVQPGERVNEKASCHTLLSKKSDPLVFDSEI